MIVTTGSLAAPPSATAGGRPRRRARDSFSWALAVTGRTPEFYDSPGAPSGPLEEKVAAPR